MPVLLASDRCVNPFVKNEEGLWAKIFQSPVLPVSSSELKFQGHLAAKQSGETCGEKEEEAGVGWR